MRRLTTAAAIAAFGAGLGTPALAQNAVSYSFLEVGYVDTEIDDIDADGDGFALRGSYAFTDMFHGFARYTDTDYDFNVSAEQIEIGAGARFALDSKLDLVATVSFLDNDVDFPGPGSTSDEGLSVGLGLRARVNPALELRGEVKYVEFDDAGDDTTLGLGASYYFTNLFALTGDIGFNDDGTTWLLGVRFDFSK